MADNNRPQGREKYVTDNSKGVHRRGDGLGAGPVGGRNSNPAGGQSGGGRAASGAGGQTRASSGKSGLIGIILAAVVLLGGGGGVLSSLLGGGSGDSLTSGLSTGVTQSALQSIAGSAGTSGWTDTANVEKLDSTVAAGSRAKRTELLGNGRDQVTIMVYMCGTDLESKSGMATSDLLEMTKATLSDNVHLVVYTGGCTAWRNQVVSAKVNQIYEIADGGLKCLETDMGSGAMTDPATLTGFIQWCAKKYPANRNELIFWDHGGGSVSGYGYDEKNARSGSMSLAGVNQALSVGGVTFDFIGFDACLMATVETGLMLDDYADYLIASEETEPGIGWYYTDWLTKFSADTSMSTIEVGRNIADDFVKTCSSQCRGQSATLSVVDLAELSNTAPDALKSFSQSLSAMISNKEYAQISTARNGSREFAKSSQIDQIDLVNFARNVDNGEGRALADALLGAVKYNRTSSDMSNAYGLSIYFPYRKTSSVSAAVSTYNAIGLDDSYSQCIREFASLEVSGQVSTGGAGTSALPSLLGSFTGSSGGSDMISGLLGSFLTGGGADFFSDRALSQEETAAFIADNFFDSTRLVWTENADGDPVVALTEDQWSLITGLDLNLFYDDGAGYVDLGLDNVFAWDADGNLLGTADGTWLAVNGQPVAYYHAYTDGDVTTGYIPALLNGGRVELLVTFDSDNPRGAIVGARSVYPVGETDTVAKSMISLTEGDTLDFLCDYYSYDGAYEDSYFLGEQMTVTDTMEISNVDVGGPVRLTYRFTDIYQQHYWTPALG